MRARYYSPALMRFVNADIVAGEISNAITLNRYAYANGNPVSNVDPFGLSAKDTGASNFLKNIAKKGWSATKEIASAIYNNADEALKALKMEMQLNGVLINLSKQLAMEC